MHHQNSIRSQGASIEEENTEVEEDDERSIAESGDDGGRSLSRRRGMRSLSRLSFQLEEGIVGTDDPNGLVRSGSSKIHPRSIVYARQYSDQIQQQLPPPPAASELKTSQRLEDAFETVFILCHLSFFGILGVLIRYGLQVLFGPQVGKVTNDNGPLYRELPANMVGSFFMGWVGIVFKKNISQFSELLAIGLSTGLMGSITTFSGWMHKMVRLQAKGSWLASFIGTLLGMELAQMSLFVGIETAQYLKMLIVHRVEINKEKMTALLPVIANCMSIILISILAVLWGGSIALAVIEFRSSHQHKIWLACACGPLGVWVRWYLSRLNGRGIVLCGKRYVKWLPVGTLVVNLSASCIMAALSTIFLKVHSKSGRLAIEAVEVGFLGCMSTVSTFVVEVRALYQSKHSWRAFIYVFVSIIPAFIVETLIYSVPVWTENLQT